MMLRGLHIVLSWVDIWKRVMGIEDVRWHHRLCLV